MPVTVRHLLEALDMGGELGEGAPARGGVGGVADGGIFEQRKSRVDGALEAHRPPKPLAVKVSHQLPPCPHTKRTGRPSHSRSRCRTSSRPAPTHSPPPASRAPLQVTVQSGANVRWGWARATE
jgi:hypothetical protein